MMNQVVTSVSLESFKDKSSGKKLVLLYPWSNYRQLFLGHFLATSADNLLYYGLPASAKTLTAWLDDLGTHLDGLTGHFGTNLKKALPKGKPDALARALADDLGAVSPNHLVLYVDELDRLPFDDTFDRFIMALIPALPDHVQLAVSSRLLKYLPWYQFVADGAAVVLGTEQRNNDIMFTVEKEMKPQLEIYAFGRGHAIVNGEEITNWDGALPRNLFFYFVDNPLVTRDDIFFTFWPNLSVKEATNVFHVTKRKISERITLKVKEPGDYELTTYTAGFYMPSDKVARHYDVEAFEDAMRGAMIADEEAEQERLFRHAVDVYKAPFLETMEIDWVIERRAYLRQLYAQALVSLGRIAYRHDDMDATLGYYTRALRESPEREDIHREVMKIYVKRGMIEDAKRQYDALKKTLKEMYSIQPGLETNKLYEEIKDA